MIKAAVIFVGMACFALMPFAPIASGNRVANLGVEASGSWPISLGTNQSTSANIGNSTTGVRQAWSFTATATGTVSSVTLMGRTQGTHTTQTFDIVIRADSANNPGSILTNGSVQFTASSASVPAAFGEFTVAYSTGPTLTNGVRYHLEVHSDQVDVTNYLQVRYQNTGTEHTHTSTESESWVSVDESCQMYGSIAGS